MLAGRSDRDGAGCLALDPAPRAWQHRPMTLLVDECRWQHRGRLWCHLVSDVSYDELHSFAADLGLPRRAFHGDHYDLPDEIRELAIDAGARPVGSRELVVRLRGAGLRLSPAARRSTH
jgi:hypothetical protein